VQSISRQDVLRSLPCPVAKAAIPTARHRPVVVRICYGLTTGGRTLVTGSVFGVDGGMANSLTFPRSLSPLVLVGTGPPGVWVCGAPDR